MMKSSSLILAWACAAFLQFSMNSEAQAVDRVVNLTGTVVSAKSGKAVAKAELVLTSPKLQGEATVATDRNGQYRLDVLPPGIYKLRVLARGYFPFRVTNIDLKSPGTSRFDVELIPKSGRGEI